MKFRITKKLRLLCLFLSLLWGTTTLAQTVNAPPTVPNGLHIVSLDHNHVTLSWDASTHPTGIYQYRIWTCQTVWGQADKFSSTNSYTIYFDQSWWSLSGQWFRLRVQAESNNNIVSEPGQDITINIPPANTVLPTMPTGLYITSLDHHHVTVAWNPSTHPEGIKQYHIWTSQTVWGQADKFSSTNSYTIYFDRNWWSLQGRYFRLRVQAESNNNLLSDNSTHIVINIPPDYNSALPNTPTNLRAFNINNSGFKVSWDSVIHNTGIMYYVVESQTAGPHFSPYPRPRYDTVTGNILNIIRTNYQQYNNAYYIKVKAISFAYTESPYSNVLVVPAYNQSISAPTNLRLSNYSQTGFALGWNASVGNNPISKYEILGKDCGYFSPTAPDFTIFINRDTTSTYIYNFRNYLLCVKIRAIDTSGNVSAWSDVLTVPIYDPSDSEIKNPKKTISDVSLGRTVEHNTNTNVVGIINNGSSLTITLPATADMNTNIQLYDLTGRIRKQVNYQNKPATLNIASLNEGSYIIRWTNKGKYQSKQIVIVR